MATALTPPAALNSVLVLGASRGIGQACALSLARSGYLVGVACRRGADAETVTKQVLAQGGRAMTLEVDVGVAAEVEAAVAALVTEGGSLAGVVNNACVVEPIGHLAETNPQDWAQLINVNVLGAYHGMRFALQAMPHGGVIVNLSSGAASNAMEGWSA